MTINLLPHGGRHVSARRGWGRSIRHYAYWWAVGIVGAAIAVGKFVAWIFREANEALR